MSSLRSLTFKDWDEVERDLQRLLRGYEQHGNWNLAQMSLHLRDWMSFPMDGFPQAPWFMRLLFACMRATVGKKLLQKTLKQGFAAGNPTLPATIHAQAEAEDAEAVERLRQTIGRFRQFTGEVHASPLFGTMDYRTAEQLQLIHVAHHLRFLKPIAESAAASSRK